MGGDPSKIFARDIRLENSRLHYERKTHTVGRIFHSDAYGAYLLNYAGKRWRYTNVYENAWGDRFYGSSSICPPELEMSRHAQRGHKCLYRIRVRLKPETPAEEAQNHGD